MEHGKCVVAIRFKNRAEYLKWKYYMDPTRKWDFDVEFPAIMRTEFEFKNAREAEILCKKIIQLLEIGFDVYTSQWKLNEIAMETTS